MLLQGGITVAAGIEMLVDDEPDKDGKMVLQKLQDNLEKGVSFYEAMSGTGYFPPYMVSMIEIGEKAGCLPETLRSLAEHYERQERLSISIKNAALYPIVLLGIMIGVVLILIVQVLPIFNDVFGRMGARMSSFAIVLMEFGIWFRGASVIIILFFCIIFTIAFFAWAVPTVRECIIKGLKNKWGDRGVLGRIDSSQFASSMAVAMSGGLNIEDSLNLLASFNQNSKALNTKYEKCISLLRLGNSLSDALKDAKILSPRDARMLSIGDYSGMADSAMAEIARRLDISLQDEMTGIVSRIEPTLVIITSVIVGAILLSVMLPLIGIMTSIG